MGFAPPIDQTNAEINKRLAIANFLASMDQWIDTHPFSTQSEILNLEDVRERVVQDLEDTPAATLTPEILKDKFDDVIFRFGSMSQQGGKKSQTTRLSAESKSQTNRMSAELVPAGRGSAEDVKREPRVELKPAKNLIEKRRRDRLRKIDRSNTEAMLKINEAENRLRMYQIKREVVDQFLKFCDDLVLSFLDELTNKQVGQLRTRRDELYRTMLNEIGKMTNNETKQYVETQKFYFLRYLQDILEIDLVKSGRLPKPPPPPTAPPAPPPPSIERRDVAVQESRQQRRSVRDTGVDAGQQVVGQRRRDVGEQTVEAAGEQSVQRPVQEAEGLQMERPEMVGRPKSLWRRDIEEQDMFAKMLGSVQSNYVDVKPKLGWVSDIEVIEGGDDGYVKRDLDQVLLEESPQDMPYTRKNSIRDSLTLRQIAQMTKAQPKSRHRYCAKWVYLDQ